MDNHASVILAKTSGKGAFFLRLLRNPRIQRFKSPQRRHQIDYKLIGCGLYKCRVFRLGNEPPLLANGEVVIQSGYYLILKIVILGLPELLMVFAQTAQEFVKLILVASF